MGNDYILWKIPSLNIMADYYFRNNLYGNIRKAIISKQSKLEESRWKMHGATQYFIHQVQRGSAWDDIVSSGHASG